VPGVQPIISRQSSVSPEASITFVSQESMKWEVNEVFQLKKRVMGVYNVTGISKKDMKFNDLTPNVEIDPEVYIHCQSRWSSHQLRLSGDFAVVERLLHVLIATVYYCSM
jgi:urease alpha subunit